MTHNIDTSSLICMYIMLTYVCDGINVFTNISKKMQLIPICSFIVEPRKIGEPTRMLEFVIKKQLPTNESIDR